ncbi:MAG TPA: bifunctional phosphopantothenoylcysteine decarboxylase/phosphopantothenate--cysteine ligase CoaBC [Candidatus Kapabacteria bacterium]|jgi:phosphopantothenoylcysteine decarboxylase/phosphopantothenate--cysteine ligase|nr:bifunctional phosphopantothenoylcysteine decarboxylase/phosphopantothenate--cysteine ligase CoaBC [Candidatus Kapabacteria bacterium]
MTRRSLSGKRIALGVTGSIAAIKSPIIVRELMNEGAEIFPVVSDGATQFISPSALSSAAGHDTITRIFSDSKSLADDPRVVSESHIIGDVGTWHIHLARSLSAMLIAPCSASTIGKLRAGIYDNPVVLLAASLPKGTPLIIVPAMDEEMWLQPAVQENIEVLKMFGVKVIEPILGRLASGLTGMGRMPEPRDIVEKLIPFLSATGPLTGKRVLITGGPTYEPIDPVRFIGNRSSGKMAVAIANVAQELGADVTLIMGPSHLNGFENAAHGGWKQVDVETADEMLRAVEQHTPQSDIIIMSAAVADFTPEHVSETKIKKRQLQDEGGVVTLRLKPTTDILSSIKQIKRPQQIVVGFALEKGEDAESYARGKLSEKDLDLIVLNNMADKGAGFGFDTNKITIFGREGSKQALPLMTKEECARHILNSIVTILPT